MDKTSFEKMEEDLSSLLSEGVITDPEKNQRSKIASLVSQINLLTQKKQRLEFEIKKQKEVLARKRTSLKGRRKTSPNKKSSTAVKASLSLEDFDLFNDLQEEELKKLKRIDDTLLSESSRILEN